MIILVLIIAVASFLFLPKIWDFSKIIMGWGEDKSEKEVDPNLVSLLKVEPAGEVLSFKQYEKWEGASQTVDADAGRYVSLTLTFDKEMDPNKVMEAIDVYEEACSNMANCVGHPDEQIEYQLVQNRPVRYAVGYSNQESKKKIYFQIQGAGNQEFLIKFKRDYIDGYCGTTCKPLDNSSHLLNPSTVMFRFEVD